MTLRQQQLWSGVGVVVLVLVLRAFGWLQARELGLLDAFLRWRWPEPTDSRIALLEIDKEAIDRLGGYPLRPGNMAAMLAKLESYEPVAIGLNLRLGDLAESPAAEPSIDRLAASESIFTVEKAFKPFNYPPLTATDPERVGFSDIPLDRGGSARRVLLGSPPDPEYRDPQAVYLFSLAARLAARYLEAQGIPLENGRRDPQTMRFRDTELPRLRSNYGGYRNADAGGTQILLLPRAGPKPFIRFTWQDIETGAISPAMLRDRLILVGITDPRYSEAIRIPSLGRATGIEFQAHATSQILSAVLGDRPLVRAWPPPVELLWIGFWGAWGAFLGLEVPTKLGLFGSNRRDDERRPLLLLPAPTLAGSLARVACSGVVLFGSGYALLVFWGWWVPVAPAALALGLNSVLPAFYALYRFDRDLRDRLNEARERQRTLEMTFNIIHNGPLQRLALLLRGIRDRKLATEAIATELERLNDELRQIIQDLAPAEVGEGGQETLRLGSGQKIDLRQPLHELFDAVYQSTLERDFPGFSSLKLQVRNFEPATDAHLDLELRRQLCQFLEEALCNVGKHAQNPTRLEAVGRSEPDRYHLRVVDNGHPTPISPPTVGGSGTRQAQKLATRLRGRFARAPNLRQGMCCELSWPQNRTFRK